MERVSDETTDATSATGSAHLLVWPDGGEEMRQQMTALIQGRIHIDGGNKCVVLGIGGEMFPVVWPRGTSMRNGSIVVPGGATIHDGQYARGGGGFLQLALANQVLRASFTIPTACRATSGEVAVFNQRERVAST
jgi:hypothetical protein